MSDTSIKQFFYLAAKNLFGLKISREEFEQSKHENFDLSENLKCMFDNKKIKNDSSDFVSDKKNISEYWRYQNIAKKQADIQYDSQDSNDEINKGFNTGQFYNSPGSSESLVSKSNDAINYLGNQLQNGINTILSSASEIQTTPSAPPVPAPVPTQVPTTVSTVEQAPTTYTQTTPEKEQETLTDSDTSGFTVHKKESSPLDAEKAIHYYKSLVNNIFPGYFDIESENSVYNMEGGENETEESQEISEASPIVPIIPEKSNSNLTQQQSPVAPTIEQNNINSENETSENFTSENEIGKDSNLDFKSAQHYYKSVVNNVFPGYFSMSSENSEYAMKGGEGEKSQLESSNSEEIKQEDNKEFEDKIITTEEKKQNENLIIVNPNKTKEKIDNINVSSLQNDQQKIEPIFPSAESTMKGGDLPDSSISQNTQNIILNAFNELTDKRKNNLF